MLVATFPSGFGDAWCGNQALAVSSLKFGILWIDFVRKKRLQISNHPDDLLYGCTVDGAWLVYSNGKSNRIDKNFPGVEHGAGWDGGVVDLWRYEIATGRRQRFAVVRSVGGHPAMAPSAFRIFLGGRHNSAISMPPPRWEAFWFTDPEWSANHGLSWFRDSSGVVQPSNTALRIEVFGPRGWGATFEPELGEVMGAVAVDSARRLYVTAGEDPTRAPRARWPLYRCNLTPQGLQGCRPLLKDVGLFELLPNDHIVYEDRNRKCIRLASPEGREDGCLAERGKFEYFSMHQVSPDGRWVLVFRANYSTSRHGIVELGPAYLFVVAIKGGSK